MRFLRTFVISDDAAPDRADLVFLFEFLDTVVEGTLAISNGTC